MGTENPVTEVEDRVPGVRFTVVQTERSKRSAMVTLRCDVADVALYEAAVAKLNGFKLFSDGLVNEALDAFSDELTKTHNTLAEKDAHIKTLETQLKAANDEVTRLAGIMTKIGLDLGLA